MTKLTQDWLVRVYDEDDAEIDSWTIENRTERQASDEAEADVGRMSDADDWTLTAVTES